MPTLEKLLEQIHAPMKRRPVTKTVQRDTLEADVRGCRRPTEFVEQKLLAALERPSCKMPDASDKAIR